MSVIKRIKKELLDYNADLLPNITAGPINNNNLFKWRATINGPEDSPNEGGVFGLQMTVSRFIQPSKDFIPISVTLSGMSMEVKF